MRGLSSIATTLKTESLFPPWHFDQWKAVDDRVRGGSSRSHLEAYTLPHRLGGGSGQGNEDEKHKSKEKEKGRTAARFWGTLDIKTLGGAGFASQAYYYGPFPLDLSRVKYSGVGLTILPSSTSTSDLELATETGTSSLASPHKPTLFTLVLKTTPTAHIPKHPRNPAPPRAASLTYEVSFTPSSFSSFVKGKTEGEREKITFEWAEFKAFYRGKEVKEGEERWVALDTATIYEISLMCRSEFGKQEGEFDLLVEDVFAILKDGVVGEGEVSKGRLRSWGWFGVAGWWSGLVSWFRGIVGTRHIRLGDDDEKADLLV